MANTKSAKKAARQTVRRTEVNKARRSRLKTFVRKVEEAIASGNKEAAKSGTPRGATRNPALGLERHHP